MKINNGARKAGFCISQTKVFKKFSVVPQRILEDLCFSCDNQVVEDASSTAVAMRMRVTDC